MSVIVPLRRVSGADLLKLLCVRPGDLTPYNGHEDHRVRSVLIQGGNVEHPALAVYLRCSCGRWLGGSC